MTRKWLAAPFLLLAFVAPARAAEQTFDRTAPLSAGARLTLENINGQVEVRGWARTEVQIHAVKRAQRDVAELGLVEIEVNTTAAGLEIATHYPQDLSSLDVTVDYLVHVPYHALLAEIATVNGNIRIAGVDTTADLRTVNGNIDAFDCAGSLSAHTTNGNIHEELARLNSAGASLETVNGSVTVALGPKAAADLDLRSMNGEVRAELPMAVRSGFVRGAVRGKIGGGGPLLHARAVNGGIQLEALQATI